MSSTTPPGEPVPVPGQESAPERPPLAPPSAEALGSPEDGSFEPEPAPPEVVPAEAHGRAGRNLPAAAAVGFGLGGIIAVTLFLARPVFVVVVAAAVVVAVVELSRAFEVAGVRVSIWPLRIGSALVVLGAFWFGPEVQLVVGALTALACTLDRMRLGSSGFVRDVTGSVFVLGYVPLLAGFAALITRANNGAWLTLIFIATVAASDLGGYAAGVAFGRHPLAPKISPKKSWEGLAGSVVWCVLVAAALVAWQTDFPWWSGAILGLLVAGTATAGDLAESMLKRDIGVKDMGNLLPGHGGIMDRLDSMLPSAFVCWAVFALAR